MEFIPSPNFWAGRAGHKPTAIVIHMTAGSFDSALSWLCNKNSQVSAHYLISRAGRVVQLVADENTAWHAGRVHNPSWSGLLKNANPNLYTLGIEHENLNFEPMTPAQWRASGALIAQLCEKWSIPICQNTLVRHHSIYSPKLCPGGGIPLGY